MATTRNKVHRISVAEHVDQVLGTLLMPNAGYSIGARKALGVFVKMGPASLSIQQVQGSQDRGCTVIGLSFAMTMSCITG